MARQRVPTGANGSQRTRIIPPASRPLARQRAPTDANESQRTCIITPAFRPLARQRAKCRGNNARSLRFVGVRWRPLARQRTRCRGDYTCSLRSVGARWHPLARQRTKNIRNNILFAIRWRSPRLAYIIIIMSGVGCGRGGRDGRARRPPSIVGPTHLHTGPLKLVARFWSCLLYTSPSPRDS